MKKHNDAANIVAEIVQLYRRTLPAATSGKDLKLASYLHVRCCLLLQASRDKKLAVDCFNESKAIVEGLAGEEAAEFKKVLANMTPAI